jgi:hypothetical protein
MRLAVVLVVALATLSALSAAVAHEPHPGLQFSIAFPSIPGCDTRDGDVECVLLPGSTYTMRVFLDGLPKDIAEYGGFDIVLEYEGVTAVGDPGPYEWPDCEFAAIPEQQPTGMVAFGCAMGFDPAPPSSYTGLVGTQRFSCGESGRVALSHGKKSTALVLEDLSSHSEAEVSETISVVCTNERPQGEFTATPSSGPIGTMVILAGALDEPISEIRLNCFYREDSIVAMAGVALPHPTREFSVAYQIPTELGVRQPRPGDPERIALSPDAECEFQAIATHQHQYAAAPFTITPGMPAVGAGPGGPSSPASAIAALAVGGATLLGAEYTLRRPGPA